MQKLLPLLLCFFLLCSCKKEKSEASVNSEENTELRENTAPDKAAEQLKTSVGIQNEKILSTSSGKEIKVHILSEANDLTTLHVIPINFNATSDTLSLENIDPVQTILVHDLDNNGFDELYIITTSTGSGSYATVHGFASNNDLSMSPVYLPEISEEDLSLKGDYYGYMGHDSIYVENKRLHRKFPVYKEGDANCCPTGGEKILSFKLVPGEATWLLVLDK